MPHKSSLLKHTLKKGQEGGLQWLLWWLLSNVVREIKCQILAINHRAAMTPAPLI